MGRNSHHDLASEVQLHAQSAVFKPVQLVAPQQGSDIGHLLVNRGQEPDNRCASLGWGHAGIVVTAGGRGKLTSMSQVSKKRMLSAMALVAAGCGMIFCMFLLGNYVSPSNIIFFMGWFAMGGMTIGAELFTPFRLTPIGAILGFILFLTLACLFVQDLPIG